VHAHNGRFAVTSQVEEIVVDGDLSDWPGDLPRYPVKHLGYEDGRCTPSSARARA